VIARTRVVVEAGGRLGRLHAEPPLTVRRVHAERADTCALCLVGTAAGPLAGDDLALELRLERGARATLTAAGAAIAQGSARTDGSRLDGHPPGGRDDGAASRLVMNASLGDHAVLAADPGALVVCAGGRVDVAVSIAMAATASVRWRELIVLGRTGAPAGAATIRWDVERDGRPVLRQFVDLTDPRLMAWPGLLAGRRVVATAFVAGPQVDANLRIAAPTAMAQPLDEHAVLITVLADDAASALRQLDELTAGVAKPTAGVEIQPLVRAER
jgi:urease accessory protein